MSAKTAKVKLCATCLVDGPWRYTESGECLGKHDCAEVVQSPVEARDDAMQSVVDAKPNQVRSVVRIISDYAASHETLSANTIRVELDIAQIDGPVVGAGFGQAVRDGIIRRDGYVPSTKPNTHSHPVAQWRSLIYRARAAS